MVHSQHRELAANARSHCLQEQPFQELRAKNNDGVNEKKSGSRFERELASRLCWLRRLVGTSGMAGPGASAKRVIDNAFDRPRTSAAFGAAAETAVDLLWMAGKIFRGADGVADIVVAEDVTGTNNHENGARLSLMRHHRYSRKRREAKAKTVFSSNSKLIVRAHWNDSRKAARTSTFFGAFCRC